MKYGKRTEFVAMVKTIQHFHQIEKMEPVKDNKGNIIDWKYDDNTSVLNRTQYSKKDKRNSLLHRNVVSSVDECREYYSKAAEEMKKQDRMILGTLLTHKGHVTKLVKVEKDYIVINDPFGKRLSNGKYINPKGEFGYQQKYSYEEVYKHRIGVLRTNELPKYKSINVIIRRKPYWYEKIFK